MKQRESIGSKVVVTAIYLIMVATNAAAVLLPLNNVTTQEVSDTYANLFAPAGLTFSIWSVIYLLLAGFVVYLWFTPDTHSVLADQTLRKKLMNVFIISSILNSIWLFAWQYFQIDLSVLIMLGLLLTLIYVNRLLVNVTLSKKEYVLIRLPFSVYFGWITIATIANITAFLVDKQLAFLQDNQVFWTVVVLIIGLFIISATMITNRDIPYGLVGIWAYFGILVKHQDSVPKGWGSEYPPVILTVMICLGILAVVCIYVFMLQIKKVKKAV